MAAETTARKLQWERSRHTDGCPVLVALRLVEMTLHAVAADSTDDACENAREQVRVEPAKGGSSTMMKSCQKFQGVAVARSLFGFPSQLRERKPPKKACPGYRKRSCVASRK
jgi:hypothetical protein